MGQWLYDPVTSALAGERRYRLPYPGGDWAEERRMNDFPLQAMRIVWVAEQVFSRDAAAWDSAENDFYMWMLANKVG